MYFYTSFCFFDYFCQKFFAYIAKMDEQYIDRETFLGLKAGDEKSFDTVYEKYYGGLCAFASQYVPVEDGKDIAQEVMMWLWDNCRTIANEKSLKSLLFTITKNKSLNHIAHQRVKQRVHEKLYQKFVEQFEDPDFYIPGELMEKLDKVIKTLPENYRKAFEMNRFDNMTYQEIAGELNISEKTIAYRISQALKILRKELSEYLPFLIWIL